MLPNVASWRSSQGDTTSMNSAAQATAAAQPSVPGRPRRARQQLANPDDREWQSQQDAVHPGQRRQADDDTAGDERPPIAGSAART